MEISPSSIMFLKKYLFMRMRDAQLACKNRIPYSIYKEITWFCAQEVLLVTFRLDLITSSTYYRLNKLMNCWNV
jgi:hypothetical protein